MKNKIFVTGTMFSRNNGPANFAMNLYNHSNSFDNIQFLTDDAPEELQNIIYCNYKTHLILKNIGMILKSFDFFLKLRLTKSNLVIWNFNIHSFFSIMFLKERKHIVFVNDSFSLNAIPKFNYNSVRSIVFRFFEKKCVKKSFKVITNSAILAKMISKEYEVDIEKISVLHKGINFDEINYFKNSYDICFENPIKVCFVKSDYKTGGLFDLCSSLELLVNFRFELDVIGPLELPSLYLNFDNIKINLHGKLDKKNVYKIVSKSDFFCVPSEREAFGQANIEAMYIKTPVVLLPTNYQLQLHNPDYVYFSHGISNLELSKTILNLIQSQAKIRKEKSELAHKIISRKYSFKQTIIDFKNIIND